MPINPTGKIPQPFGEKDLLRNLLDAPLLAAGLPYTVHLVDLRRREHKRDDYLTLNPTGQIGTLVERTVKPGLS